MCYHPHTEGIIAYERLAILVTDNSHLVVKNKCAHLVGCVDVVVQGNWVKSNAKTSELISAVNTKG